MSDSNLISYDRKYNLSVLNVFIGEDKNKALSYISKYHNVIQKGKCFSIENYSIKETEIPYNISISFFENDINKIGTIRIVSSFFSKKECERLMLYIENLLPNGLLRNKINENGKNGRVGTIEGTLVKVEEFILSPINSGMRYILYMNIKSVLENNNDVLMIKKMAFEMYKPEIKHSIKIKVPDFHSNINLSKTIKILLAIILLIAIYMYVLNNRYVIKPPFRYDKWTNKAEYINYKR